MSRAAMILLWVGTALFVALLATQGFGAVVGMLMVAGWGLAVVAAFHLVPLALDAWAIHVLFEKRRPFRDALLARWSGESVNSLLPAGQIGGPVLMARHLAQRGVPMGEAAAAITVSTTVQTLTQVVFAIIGLVLFGAYAMHDGDVAAATSTALRVSVITALAVVSLLVAAFWWAQRRGLFGRLARMATRAFGIKDGTDLATNADTIDTAVVALYGRHRKVFASFVANLVGWIVGTGEVWLALHFLGHPVGWLEALLLESMGQAIRGAAFAIPGSLGVQEGGYLLLAPLVGLPPDAALALSLVKRARELALGVPGLLYLHLSERNWRRRSAPVPVVN